MVPEYAAGDDWAAFFRACFACFFRDGAPVSCDTVPPAPSSILLPDTRRTRSRHKIPKTNDTQMAASRAMQIAR